MKTNNIKKGDRVKMRGTGWEGTMMDNKRGNIRDVRVEGTFTEVGSVYSHDIEFVKVDGKWKKVEHTKAQLELKKTIEAAGIG